MSDSRADTNVLCPRRILLFQYLPFCWRFRNRFCYYSEKVKNTKKKKEEKEKESFQLALGADIYCAHVVINNTRSKDHSQ